MAFDETKFQEALANVLQRFGKAKWIQDATVIESAMRVKFTTKGATDMLILKNLFEQVGWPKDAYEILAFIELAKIPSHADGQVE